MPTFIHHIETVVPEAAYRQEAIREIMKRHFTDDRKIQRIIHRFYNESDIAIRHSVIRDLEDGAPPGLFYDHEQDTIRSPTTRERNDLYAKLSRPLYTCLARKTITQCPGVQAADITHVITVSCTGFYAPGPDYFIVKELDLAPSTRRFHLGFMGCYAAISALGMAHAFCEADPKATVLFGLKDESRCLDQSIIK